MIELHRTSAVIAIAHLTDIAARPSENPHFQNTRNNIDKRSDQCLKDLEGQRQNAGFDLNV